MNFFGNDFGTTMISEQKKKGDINKCVHKIQCVAYMLWDLKIKLSLPYRFQHIMCMSVGMQILPIIQTMFYIIFFLTLI